MTDNPSLETAEEQDIKEMKELFVMVKVENYEEVDDKLEEMNDNDEDQPIYYSSKYRCADMKEISDKLNELNEAGISRDRIEVYEQDMSKKQWMLGTLAPSTVDVLWKHNIQ